MSHTITRDTECVIINKWFGDLAVTYLFHQVDDDDNQWLLFYSENRDPHFSHGDIMRAGDMAKGAYKSVPFVSIAESVPDDMTMAVFW